MGKNINYTTRRLTIAARMTIEEANRFELELAGVMNLLPPNLSMTAAYWMIFRRGLEIIMEQAENGLVTDERLVLARELARLDQEDTRTAALSRIYSRLGPGEFRDFCDKNGIDHEAFLNGYAVFLNQKEAEGDLSWAEKALAWLRHRLGTEEAGEMSTADIKKAALDDEIIKDETGWKNLTVLAHRKGFNSDKKGVWKSPAAAAASSVSAADDDADVPF